MGSRQSVVRIQGGIGPSRPTIASFCVVLAVWAFLTGAISLAISTPSLNHPAFEARLDFYLNSTDTGACDANAAAGNTTCIRDAFKVNRFANLQWYILYGILPLGLFTVMTLVPMLMWNAERVFWWIMALFVALFFVACSMVVVMLAIYWWHCKQHDFCVPPGYFFDFTGYVKFHRADRFWILHCCGHFMMWLASIAIAVTTLYLQYLAGFAVMAMQMSGFSRSPDMDNRIMITENMGDDGDDVAEGAETTTTSASSSQHYTVLHGNVSGKHTTPIAAAAVSSQQQQSAASTSLRLPGTELRQRPSAAAAVTAAAGVVDTAAATPASIAERFNLPTRKP